MKMKKIAWILMLALTASLLAGCGGSEGLLRHRKRRAKAPRPRQERKREKRKAHKRSPRREQLHCMYLRRLP